jgi:hypothetical protein
MIIAIMTMIYFQKTTITGFDIESTPENPEEKEQIQSMMLQKRRNSKEEIIGSELRRSFSYRDFKCRDLNNEKDVLQTILMTHSRKSMFFLILVCCFPLFFFKSS